MMDYEQGLKAARLMQLKNPEIIEAIHKVQEDNHGVVALKFRENQSVMDIVILDEPFEPNVRVYMWAEDEIPDEEMGG